MLLNPFRGHNFFVEIEGLFVGGFAECSGLEVETDLVEYREGGVNDHTHRFAGATRSPPLLLRNGITVNDSIWRWCQMTAAGEIVRRNGTVYLLDRAQELVVHWHFKEAFPYKWTGPELRADTASIAFESVALAHRGLRRGSPRQAALLGAAQRIATRVAGG